MQFSRSFPLLLLALLTACQEVSKPAISAYPAVREESARVEEDSLALKPGVGLVYYKNEPFTGLAVSYFENGNQASGVDYIRGKKHGVAQKWFDNGAPSFKSHYVEGKIHGTTYSWWKNGQLRSESNHEEGIPHGIQKQWYASGAKFKKINLVYGKEQGLQQSWRENGKLYDNYEARNGRIFGLKRANLCYELEDENIKYQD